mmetsp:Transcript_12482/g.27587  ORF Transcript_12482/g.27587 Transcript_12482/m.27587 type:complete len:219 (-) Transcript_12482:854-1510(-)
MRLSPRLIHISLHAGQLTKLRFQGGDALVGLGNGGLRLVSLGGERGDLTLVVILLGLGLSCGLGAPLVLLSISLSLLTDALQHVTDQPLDLGENVIGGTGHGGRVDLRSQQGHGHVAGGFANGPQTADHLVDRASLGSGLHLHQSVGLGGCATRHLRDHSLGLAQSLQLLGAALHAGLVVGGGLHAVQLQVAQSVLVRGGILLVLLQVLRGRCQSLLV